MSEKKEQLLVVDDDPALCSLLSRYLTENGYHVTAVQDGVEMKQVLATQEVDLVILDLMLPGEDGLTLAKQLRSESHLPLIMISARGDDVDRIVGLEIGADDYLAKPFNPRELLARIRAVMRRRSTSDEQTAGKPAAQIIAFGPYRLDLQRHQLFYHDEVVALTTGEFSLLRIFAEHPNQVLERDALLSQLKGYERNPYDRSIDVRITRLRRKLETDPSLPSFIRTVWGEGYMFCPDS
ncbi:MAG: response regulator [Gammaproteobacteria bacterium]|nr:response regulator [Gammaproteobacteria bacterium]MCW8839691.1 response regulator [Gammaproteobacteria bacterium]MCW8928171.1 response regulator [Gammaproteobacteria bacterium]MCW8958303.1 response regulator [Gammaproteobacteria bacterium]MCW8972447.1 response regulator [Gammaproteobacteria bacterium]